MTVTVSVAKWMAICHPPRTSLNGICACEKAAFSCCMAGAIYCQYYQHENTNTLKDYEEEM
jgi:hypothetical protein